jgi:hypothetical protein
LWYRTAHTLAVVWLSFLRRWLPPTAASSTCAQPGTDTHGVCGSRQALRGAGLSTARWVCGLAGRRGLRVNDGPSTVSLLSSMSWSHSTRLSCACCAWWQISFPSSVTCATTTTASGEEEGRGTQMMGGGGDCWEMRVGSWAHPAPRNSLQEKHCD